MFVCVCVRTHVCIPLSNSPQFFIVEYLYFPVRKLRIPEEKVFGLKRYYNLILDTNE